MSGHAARVSVRAGRRLTGRGGSGRLTVEHDLDQLPEEPRVRYMQELAKQREEWKPMDERDVVMALRHIVERAEA